MTGLQGAGNTGIFFFLAAAKGDQREFVLPLLDGKPTDPVHAFALTKSRAGFRAKETLFALSEPIVDGTSFRTRLLHIETDSRGKPAPIDAPDVTYGLFIRKENDVYSLRYRLTPDSVKELEKRGFHDGYPAEFERSAKGFDPQMLEKRLIDPRLVSMLPIPPHHQTPLAMIARKFFTPGAILPSPVRIDADEWEAPAVLAGLDGAPQAGAAQKPGLVQSAGPDIVIVSEMPPPPKP